jgi:tetratricopeptide (TPR) repeat protein
VRRLVTTALIALVTAASAGCQQGGTASLGGSTAARPAVGVEQLRADGVAALEKGRYESALRAFAEALSRLPDDVGLHYLLAVTYSHLDRKDDATLAFRYVVQHGKPGSQEVQAATRWLAGVGIVIGRAEPAPPDPPEVLTASLQGKIVWPLGPDRAMPRLQLQLEGIGPTTQGKRYGIFAHFNGLYAFPQVRPGDYRLRAQIAYTRVWEMDVTVGDKTVLDLTQDNAVARDLLKNPS